MSSLAIDPNGATPPNPAESGGGSGDGGTQTPAGFVPQAELDRVEAQRRDWQRQADQARAELAQAQAAATPPPAPADNGSFDPEAFRRQLVGEVAVVTQLHTAAVQFRTDYPNADPAIFSPDLIAQFGSVEALRFAAEADHLRVTALVDAGISAKEAEIRAANAAAHGGGSGNPGEPGTPGDPTATQLNAMSPADWDELERRNPGVIDRVLRSAN